MTCVTVKTEKLLRAEISFEVKRKEKKNTNPKSWFLPSVNMQCTSPLKQAHIDVGEASYIIIQVPQELFFAHKSKCYKNERQHKHNWNNSSFFTNFRPNRTTHLYQSHYSFIKSFGRAFWTKSQKYTEGGTVLTQRCEAGWSRVELEPVKSKEDGTYQWAPSPSIQMEEEERRQRKC